VARAPLRLLTATPLPRFSFRLPAALETAGQRVLQCARSDRTVEGDWSGQELLLTNRRVGPFRAALTDAAVSPARTYQSRSAAAAVAGQARRLT
jgi:hypothetical protein